MRRVVCSQMFQSATAFNQNLGSWNVVDITNLNTVCPGARRVRACEAAPRCGLALLKIASALGRLGAWAGVSHVGAALASVPCGLCAMRRAVCLQMFQSATNFNQDLGSWNVAKVWGAYGTFNGATAFNQNLGSWNVVSITMLDTVCPYCPSRARAGVWGRASVWAGLALASGLGRFGASAGGASHAAVALASVPRGLCEMRRLTARGLFAGVCWCAILGLQQGGDLLVVGNDAPCEVSYMVLTAIVCCRGGRIGHPGRRCG
jgi:hypothetical protein